MASIALPHIAEHEAITGHQYQFHPSVLPVSLQTRQCVLGATVCTTSLFFSMDAAVGSVKVSVAFNSLGEDSR